MAECRLRDAKPDGGAGKASLFSNNRECGKFAKIILHDS
jgi:hypothetical protein